MDLYDLKKRAETMAQAYGHKLGSWNGMTNKCYNCGETITLYPDAAKKRQMIGKILTQKCGGKK